MLDGARARARQLGAEQRRVPGAQRRMDRPAARQRRRRALPLGLHADGRPRGGAGRDPTRARARRTRRAGRVGCDRAATPGRCFPARSWSSAALRQRRTAESEQRPGPFALGSAARVGELLAQAGFAEVDIEALELPRTPPRASRSCGRRRSISRAPSTTRCSRAPPPRSRRSRLAGRSASRHTPPPTARSRYPGARSSPARAPERYRGARSSICASA